MARRQDMKRWSVPLVVLICLPLLWGCGATPRSPEFTATSSQRDRPQSADAWVREVERLVRRGEDARALAAVAGARKSGVPRPRLLALESVVRWRLSQDGKAAAVDRQLSVAVGAALLVKPPVPIEPELLQTFERMVAFHVTRRHKPAHAWAMIAPLLEGGCSRRSVCDLAGRVLANWPQAPAALLARVKRAAPRSVTVDGSKADEGRYRWSLALLRDLIASQRWQEYDALLASTLKEHKHDPRLWSEAYVAARRRRGLQHRRAWLSQLKAARLPIAELTTLTRSNSLTADRLMTAEIWRLVVTRHGATQAHWIALVEALGTNIRRGSAQRPRAELTAIARTRANLFTSVASRQQLAAVLLAAGLPEIAAPWIKRLMAAELSPETMILRADLLRQRGKLPAARRQAHAAWQEADDPAAVAWRIAELWDASLPADAGQWRQRAGQGQKGASLEALALRATRHLSRSRLPIAAERELLAYARALVEASRRSGPDSAPADPTVAHRLKEFIVGLLARRSNIIWRRPLTATLEILANTPQADVRLLEALARLKFEGRAPNAGLAAYKRARALSERDGYRLDDEAMVRAVLRTNDSRVLARWLRASGMEQVEDLALSWTISRKLMLGPDRRQGRRWVERTLARFVGVDVLASSLSRPQLKKANKRTRVGRTPSLHSNHLEQIAHKGAADLLLEYVRDARPVPGDAASMADEIKYARVESVALVALGRADEAERVLRQTWRLGGKRLSEKHKRGLMTLAWQSNLCTLVLDMAIELSVKRSRTVVNRAIDRGLACARATGDAKRAFSLAARFEKGQIDRRRHLHLATRLSHHGFHTLALPLFQRNHGDLTKRRNNAILMPWARSLLALGRHEDAVRILRVSRRKSRRAAHVAQEAARLLEEFGYLKEAEPFIRFAIDRRPDVASARAALLRNMLRSGELQDFRVQMLAFFRLGPGRQDLLGLADEVERQGQLDRVHEALADAVEPDRELERFRMDIASRLGLRKAVAASARRLRSGGRSSSGEAIERLLQVGATREAREAAEDLLASASPGARAATGEGSSAELLRHAMAVRRDPTSSQEAAGIARLYVGKALDAGKAAGRAAEVMARHGEAELATALRAVALEHAPTDAMLLCRQGADLFAIGRREPALVAWRAAMAALLMAPRAGRLLRRPESRLARNWGIDEPAGRCVVDGLRRAQETGLLTSWLERWLDALPQRPALWGQLVDVHVHAGEMDAAIAALRRASVALSKWQQRSMDMALLRIVEQGGGSKLLAWLLDHPAELRAEPWWLERALALALEQASPQQRRSAGWRRLLVDIEAMGRSNPEARFRIAALWARHGQTARALKALGRKPFALDPRADWKSLKLRQRAAASAAAVLISLSRNGPGAVTEDVEVDTPAPAFHFGKAGRLPLVREQIGAWLGASPSAEELERLAASLIEQGHPELATQAMSMTRRHRLVRVGADAAWVRLRVQIGLGDAASVAAAARAYISEPGSRTHKKKRPAFARRMAQATRIPRRTYDVVSALSRAGRLDVARQVAATERAATFRIGPPQVVAGANDSKTGTEFIELVRRHDPLVLTRMADPDRDLPPRSLALAAVEVAVAAGRSDLAIAWAGRIAATDDEPWRAWLQVLRSATRFNEIRLATGVLRRVAKAGAPAGAMACPQLWLLGEGRIADCRRGRPLTALIVSAPDDFADLALAVAKGGDPGAAAAITDELVAAPEEVVVAWIGALSEHRGLLSATDRIRLKAHLQILIGRVAPAPRKRRVLGFALDDLAMLGVPQPGVAQMEQQFRLAPDAPGSRNNLAYARYLAGASAAGAWKLAAPVLGRSTGRTAHPLLDTLAACLWSAGHKEEAVATLRGALIAGVEVAGGGLPQVRLAEYLLAGGDHRGAMQMALIALDGAKNYQHHLLTSEFWQLDLDTFDAMNRARVVIRKAHRKAR